MLGNQYFVSWSFFVFLAIVCSVNVHATSPGFVSIQMQQNETLFQDNDLNSTETSSARANETSTPPSHYPALMDCEQKLLEEAYVCVTKNDIDFNHFLLMAVSKLKEGANVTQPAIIEGVNMADFREKVCRARTDIMQCTFKAAKGLMVTPACVSGTQSSSVKQVGRDPNVKDQRYLIKEQMEAILGQYDAFCAEPCRLTLVDDMKSCYKRFGLDTSLFLTNKVNGPVIGSDSWEVDTFCKNREELVSCLKKTRDSCPESKQVLSALALDLDTAAKGFEVLCARTDECRKDVHSGFEGVTINDNNSRGKRRIRTGSRIYLKGLQCFENHPHQVGVCHSVKYREVLRVAKKATELKWTSDKYFGEVCGVVLKHIECDLEAWGQYKSEKCDKNIVNLKRQLHCSLVHKQCQKTHGDLIYTMCESPAVQEFFLADSSAGRASVSMAMTSLSLFLALVASLT